MINTTELAPVILNEVKRLDENLHDLAVANITNTLLAAELATTRQALDTAVNETPPLEATIEEDEPSLDDPAPAAAVPSKEQPDTPEES